MLLWQLPVASFSSLALFGVLPANSSTRGLSWVQPAPVASQWLAVGQPVLLPFCLSHAAGQTSGMHPRPPAAASLSSVPRSGQNYT